jgi:two-component system OmpR family sensor kinase/two-component system sensor histidine kinase QseC
VTSIRTRLLVSLLSVVVLSAAIGAGITYFNALRESESLFDYQLRQMALSLRDQGFIPPDEAAALANDDLDFVVQIWTADGTRLYASHPGQALPPRAVLGFADVQLGEGTWRIFSTATRDRVIQVAQPLAIRRQLAAQAALRTVVPILALTPILAVAIGWSVGVSLRPVRRLVVEVKRRDADALEPVAQSGLPSEVSPLVESINALLGRLRNALDAQRAFVSDAAHELRSPLTALKLQLQLLQRSSDTPSRAEAIEALSSGIERATRLVSQLLTLARAEPGGPQQPLAPTDLAEVARQAIADVLPLADAKSVRLGLDAQENCIVEGDAPALRILVRNLADNAVRYTPAGGRVELTVAADGDHVTLAVDDSGPGIPASERERVFARFYRGSGDGEAGRDETGSGLGLAIVRSIAQRHAASLHMMDSPLGGLRVEAHLVRSGHPAVTSHAGTTAPTVRVADTG